MLEATIVPWVCLFSLCATAEIYQFGEHFTTWREKIKAVNYRNSIQTPVHSADAHPTWCPLVLLFKGTVGCVMENTRHEDQAGSSSNLFPVAINFASIIFQVTFGISPEVSTEEMNGGKMKHLCLSGKGLAGPSK